VVRNPDLFGCEIHRRLSYREFSIWEVDGHDETLIGQAFCE
jgi:hypothetical protein